MRCELYYQVSPLTRAVFKLLHPISPSPFLDRYNAPREKQYGGIRLLFESQDKRLLEIAGATVYSFYIEDWGFSGPTIACPDDATFIEALPLIRELINSRRKTSPYGI